MCRLHTFAYTGVREREREIYIYIYLRSCSSLDECNFDGVTTNEEYETLSPDMKQWICTCFACTIVDIE